MPKNSQQEGITKTNSESNRVKKDQELVHRKEDQDICNKLTNDKAH